MAHEATITSLDDFTPDTEGQASRWATEMEAADKELEPFLKKGEKIVDRFRDKRTNTQKDASRINLFTANIQTVRAMLYGNLPAVDVKRRYDDAQDDPARVAATILERLLNNDIQREEDSYADVLRQALDDRLMPGLGVARVRYEAGFEDLPIPEGYEIPEGEEPPQRKAWEEADVDYVHWKDVRWSPARTWSELRWLAFRSYLTKDQIAKRFGKATANSVPYESGRKRGRTDSNEHDPWQRAQVWEIWCIEERKVYWWVRGYSKLLDVQDDPLELSGFWPCPPFLSANLTTESLVPTADFSLHQDLYDEIDYVSTRIERLERAVKAVGVYDKSATGVQRMLTEAFDNDLIPVDNWAVFSEKQGLKGVIDWMPLADIVNALDKLRDYRRELIDLLYQVSGMSDILRGASTAPNVTATEQGLKARFASVRITALQDAFAEFASRLQQLRAEVIVRHFDDETIVQRSNIMASPDRQLVGPALQLLRGEFAQYRIEIEPDNIARADYAALKSERTEYLTALGTFINQAMPLATAVPGSAPALVQIIQWASAGFRGGAKVETVLDQMLTQMAQGQGQQQQKPSEEAIKAQAKEREIQMKAQAKMEEIKRKLDADMQKMRFDFELDRQKIDAELQADMQRERQQAEMNALEEQAKARARSQEKIIAGRFGA